MISVLIFISSLIVAAFFAATEVAFFSLNPLSVTRGNRAKLEKLFLSKNDIIAMLLTGNSLAVVCGTLALDALLPVEEGVGYKVLAFVCELVLFFTLSEALPKAIGRRKNILLLERSYYVIWIFYYLLLPMSYVFLRISRQISRIKGVASEDARLEVFRFISDQSGESHLPLTESLAAYSRTTIREIMTPMNEISSLGAGQTLAECAELIEKSSYSRYPVYDNIPANIVGYADLRDMLVVSRSSRVRQIVREAQFFPDSLSVEDLHAQMRRLTLPMVFVVNEYGLILGMVTEENLAEELVGDILSHDQKLEAQYLQIVEPGIFEIDAAMDIDDFMKYFSTHIEKEHYETLGGYLLHLCGRIPDKDQEIDSPLGKFTIVEASRRSVRRVRFKPRRAKMLNS